METSWRHGRYEVNYLLAKQKWIGALAKAMRTCGVPKPLRGDIMNGMKWAQWTQGDKLEVDRYYTGLIKALLGSHINDDVAEAKIWRKTNFNHMQMKPYSTKWMKAKGQGGYYGKLGKGFKEDKYESLTKRAWIHTALSDEKFLKEFSKHLGLKNAAEQHIPTGEPAYRFLANWSAKQVGPNYTKETVYQFWSVFMNALFDKASANGKIPPLKAIKGYTNNTIKPWQQLEWHTYKPSKFHTPKARIPLRIQELTKIALPLPLSNKKNKPYYPKGGGGIKLKITPKENSKTIATAIHLSNNGEDVVLPEYEEEKRETFPLQEEKSYIPHEEDDSAIRVARSYTGGIPSAPRTHNGGYWYDGEGNYVDEEEFDMPWPEEYDDIYESPGGPGEGEHVVGAEQYRTPSPMTTATEFSTLRPQRLDPELYLEGAPHQSTRSKGAPPRLPNLD